LTVNSGNNAATGDQIRGFGFMHDGSFDTGLRRLQMSLFTFPGGDAQRRAVEQFTFAFDSNLKPVVGQQATLRATAELAAVARVDLLIARAAAGNADLIVTGNISGAARGWLRLADGTFRSSRAVDLPLSEVALRSLAATVGQELTFTAVPPGSGLRIGIDRDQDNSTDGDDNCLLIANANQLDADGDGYGNRCDADLNNSGTVTVADFAMLRSVLGEPAVVSSLAAAADLNGSGVVTTTDFAILRGALGTAPGPSALVP
jgi:hypothetical protein